MADFNDKGFALLQLFHPEYALDAWDDINQYALHQIIGMPHDLPLYGMVSPLTPKFNAFIFEIDKVSSGPLIVS